MVEQELLEAIRDIKEDIVRLAKRETNEAVLKHAVKILWSNGFSICVLMHLFGLIKKDGKRSN